MCEYPPCDVNLQIDSLWLNDNFVNLQAFADSRNLSLAHICFVGDDVNDLPAFAVAGWSAAPADAHPRAKAAVDFVAQACGGRGAVREILDHLMSEQIQP